MPSVEIYTTPYCPFCIRAKKILKKHGLDFVEIDVQAPDRREAMTERAGGRTSVPQIFFDGTHVGGCDDLQALEREGKLDSQSTGQTTDETGQSILQL